MGHEGLASLLQWRYKRGKERPWPSMTRVKVHGHSPITQLRKILITWLEQKHPKHMAVSPLVFIPQSPTCCHWARQEFFTYDNYARGSDPSKNPGSLQTTPCLQLQALWGSRELASSWINYAAQVGHDLQDLKLGKPTAEGQRRSIAYIA